MKRRTKLETLQAEMTGRYSAMENLTVTLFAHVAGAMNDPAVFIRDVMINVDDNLRAARRNADADDEAAADVALSTFERLSKALLTEVHRRTPPAGHG
jgi:hypothetical protein